MGREKTTTNRGKKSAAPNNKNNKTDSNKEKDSNTGKVKNTNKPRLRKRELDALVNNPEVSQEDIQGYKEQYKGYEDNLLWDSFTKHDLKARDVQQSDQTELLIMKTEVLMLRGMRKKEHISKALGVTYGAADRYIRAVYLRWKFQVKRHDVEEMRADILNTYDALSAGLWERLQTIIKDVKEGRFITRVKKEKAKDGEDEPQVVAILDRARAEQIINNMFRTLGNYQRHRAEVGGLTRANIENKFHIEINSNSGVSEEEFERLEAAKDLLFAVAKDMGFIEGEATVINE